MFAPDHCWPYEYIIINTYLKLLIRRVQDVLDSLRREPLKCHALPERTSRDCTKLSDALPRPVLQRFGPDLDAVAKFTSKAVAAAANGFKSYSHNGAAH